MCEIGLCGGNSGNKSIKLNGSHGEVSRTLDKGRMWPLITKMWGNNSTSAISL